MHLKLLKLGGFKSFVDPTVVPLPSQLTAVAGPNGCGKSNIIDAIRWVLGESSAKNLRGESMTDVIFNGSSGRKPMGQAFVELVFDNSMGRITGEFAGYHEISIRRVVSRDGHSDYFLNGTRCRRKDITDVFLGTGASARGYSIISQGTISKIVEARPEELRSFLEEAGGISRYRERRRETLTRMNQTRENLLRVEDIRDELTRQLERLERQAQSAKLYQRLKRDEHLCRADITALKWQKVNADEQTVMQDIRQQQSLFEENQAVITTSSSRHIHLKENIHEHTQNLEKLQNEFYQLGREIVRLEENSRQKEKDKKRLEAAEEHLQQELKHLNRHIEDHETELLASLNVCAKLSAELVSAEEHYQNNCKEFASLQATRNELDERSQSDKQSFYETQRVHEGLNINLQHLKQKREDILLRLEKLSRDEEDNRFNLAAYDIEKDKNSLHLLHEELNEEEKALQTLRTHQKEHQDHLEAAELALRIAQDNSQQVNSEKAAATISLKTALSGQKNDSSHPWHDALRLMDVMSVEDTWQKATEWILGDQLNACVLPAIPVTDILSCPDFHAVFTETSPPLKNPGSKPVLADKISGQHPCSAGFLNKIYIVETVDEALLSLPHLKPDESVLTPCCLWMGKGWLKRPGGAITESLNLFELQSRLSTLTETFDETIRKTASCKEERDACLEKNKLLQEKLHLAEINYSLKREDFRTMELKIHQQTFNFQQAQSFHEKLLIEKEELFQDLEETHTLLEEKSIQIENTKNKLTESQNKLAAILNEDKVLQARLQNSQKNLEDSRQIVHQLELQHTREQMRVKQFTDAIERFKKDSGITMQKLHKTTEELQALLMVAEHGEPDTALKRMQHDAQEKELNLLKNTLDELNTLLLDTEHTMKTLDKQAKQMSDALQQKKLELQSLQVRGSALLESLQETSFELSFLLNQLPADITPAVREEQLQQIVRKIERLGAVNLAAIEEYETESSRRDSLEKQYLDLTDALSTLEMAIEKMDKETRKRLQHTFDEVNGAFQVLFPKLFGGGTARLEFTGEDLSEAGITVMAQPPGKRNSTIHLLSGGEKAMTAVALVFAIFQLNPSPFCLLDEVDAPLDELNIGRFCSMVKEMSQVVQFMFITHNKTTMELADHLIGVTMREPGVSRVVAVDVEQALAMAES